MVAFRLAEPLPSLRENILLCVKNCCQWWALHPGLNLACPDEEGNQKLQKTWRELKKKSNINEEEAEETTSKTRFKN